MKKVLLSLLVLMFCMTFVTAQANPNPDYAITTGQGIIFLTTILIFFSIIFGMLWFSLNINYQPVKIFLISLSVIMLVFTVGYTLRIMQGTLGPDFNLTDTFSSFYIMLTILMTGLALALIMYFIVFVFKTFQKTRGFDD